MGGSVMKIGRIIQQSCIKRVFGALALFAATCIHATTTLVGGGAIWPAPGYVGTAAYTGQQVASASTKSLFGVLSAQLGVTISYCLSGDLNGMNIFDGAAGTVQGACPATSGAFQGFGAASVGRTDLLQPDYGSTSVPYSQANLENYLANHASGAMPVQFPAIAGAVGVALNKTDDQGVALNASNVNFSDTQLCGIFSGQITTWNSTALASAFTLPAGHTVSGPIHIQYLNGGDGTTFAFFNHLSSVCSGTASAHFITNETLATAVGLYLPSLPSNWTPSNSYQGLVAAIADTAGSLGFVAADFAINANLSMGEVDGSSPVNNFGSTMTISAGDLLYNEVITGNNPITGSPVLGAISPTPSTQCIAVVDPASYAAPASGYPIVAMAYLLGNAQGNGVDLADNRALLAAPYNHAVTGSRNLAGVFGAGTGLAFLNVDITASDVAACLIN
jgi:ABC-type phosphate transport system substrate-binding protein